MATRVLKELAVATGTYEDRNSGQMKNRYANIGAIMESTNQQGETNMFILLDRHFNPAGVPFKPGSDQILISAFDPKPRDGQQRGNDGGSYSGQQNGGGYGGGGHSGYDDEIPL